MLIAGYARRPIGAGGYRLDMFGLDSDYDYDPLWATCVELGVAPVVHSALQQHRVTRSISNYVYNHVNGLAAAHESLCKSLFLVGRDAAGSPSCASGSSRVGWRGRARCSRRSSATGRSATATRSSSSIPTGSTSTRCSTYFAEYGDDEVTARIDELREYFGRPAARPAQVDEFAAVGIETADDLRARFEPNFYFGCEADDPLVAWAFRDDVNPLGTRLRPVLGSDISHWDVRDMTEPVAEAYELVEHGVITERDFRDLTFVNPVRLHAGPNPEFFDGHGVRGGGRAGAGRGGEVGV